MAAQLFIGAAITFISMTVHVLFIGAAMLVIERAQMSGTSAVQTLRRAAALGLIALWLSVAHAVAIWLWAMSFLWLGAFEEMDTAVYFAGVAFTTLGFGDIIPPREWRQLAGFSAANGLLMFGVSAAVLVEALREMNRRSRASASSLGD